MCDKQISFHLKFAFKGKLGCDTVKKYMYYILLPLGAFGCFSNAYYAYKTNIKNVTCNSHIINYIDLHMFM
jgi:hypothetical protein